MQIRTFTLILMLGTTIALPLFNRPCISAEDDSKLWVSQHYETAVNFLLPPNEVEDRKFWRELEWAVSVRILPPFDSEREFQFQLCKGYDGQISGVAVYPIDNSIRKQMEELHKGSPTATVEEILRKIRMNRLTVTTGDFPDIVHIAKQFEDLKIPSVLSGELYMDPTSYEFWSGARAESIRLWLNSASNHPKDSHPLINWAERTRKTLEKRPGP